MSLFKICKLAKKLLKTCIIFFIELTKDLIKYNTNL